MSEESCHSFNDYREFRDYLLNDNEVLEISKKSPIKCPDLRVLPEDVKVGDITAVVSGGNMLVLEGTQHSPMKKNSLVCVKMCGIAHYSSLGYMCGGRLDLRPDGTLSMECVYDRRLIKVHTR